MIPCDIHVHVIIVILSVIIFSLLQVNVHAGSIVVKCISERVVAMNDFL